MKLFRFGLKSDIQTNNPQERLAIKTIPALELPWGNNGILIWVSSGKGALKWVYGYQNEDLIAFLLLNNIPLVRWQSWNGCPTCDQLLTAGYGIEKVDESTIDAIRSCSSSELNLNDQKSLDDLKPLLNLLKQNVYLITYIPHFPSDGEGNFFWNMSNTVREYKALKYSWYGKPTPKFLIPTQTLSKLDRERVKYYRKKIQNGEFIGAITYYMGGYMSALLDGHHRATAALLEGIPLNCLTILSPEGIRYGNNNSNQPDKIMFPGYEVEVSSIPQNICKQVLSNYRFEELTPAKMQSYLGMISDRWSIENFPKEWNDLVKQLPTYLGIEAMQKAGDLSDERIESLIKSSDFRQEENLLDVMRALIALKDPRARAVTKRIASSLMWAGIWKEAYLYLATIKTQEIDDFFIEFLINDDKSRPEITKIVDDYFKEF